MKNLCKMMPLFLFMLLSYNINTFSYDYTVVNKTGKDVKVQLKRVIKKLHPKPQFIKAGRPYTFYFNNKWCLDKIMVSIKEKGEWSKFKKAKIEFLRKDGKKMSLGDRLDFAVQGGARTLSMCNNKKFFLRFNPRSKKISANVKTGR